MIISFDPSKVVILANAHDTLKNDDYRTGSVTIPGSVSIAAGSQAIYTADITVGANQSMADIRVQSSRDTSQDYLASVQLSFTRTGNLGPYSVYATAFHVSATIVRIQAFAINPYGATLTGQAGDETFSFKIRTFKAPW